MGLWFDYSIRNNSIHTSVQKSILFHTKVQKSNNPYQNHSFHTFDLLFSLILHSSLFLLLLPYPFLLSPPKTKNETFLLVLSLSDFNIFPFCIFGPQTPLNLHFHLFKFLLWHTIFCSFVIWVLNWQFINLPLTIV